MNIKIYQEALQNYNAGLTLLQNEKNNLVSHYVYIQLLPKKIDSAYGRAKATVRKQAEEKKLEMAEDIKAYLETYNICDEAIRIAIKNAPSGKSAEDARLALEQLLSSHFATQNKIEQISTFAGYSLEKTEDSEPNQQ